MKFKTIAAACAVLCSASAFAAPLNPKTDLPEVTFYVAGASAQKAALSVAALDVFATPADVIAVKGPASNGWYGMSKAALTGGTSKRLFVVYNSTGGSNAGVAQVMSNGTSEPEANVVTVGNAGCGATTGGANTYAVTCTINGVLEADMALSDVQPSEAVPGVLPTEDAISISQLSVQTTALEGFGVAVNPALYAALQEAQGLTGCAGNTGAACQPSIRRADYASLITLDGTIKDAGALLGNGDTTPLTLVRRVDSSGTQAASNIFFANNVCGSAGYFGALSPLSQWDSNPGVFDIAEESETGGVRTKLTGTNTEGYAIGVMSLENIPTTAATSYQYVKLDGVSPNFNADGTPDLKMRNAFASGSYPFAVEMTAMYRASAPAQTKAIANTIATGLKSPLLHNLAGLAYLDGTYTVGGKVSRVSRNGNNCAPLVVVK